MTIPQGKIEAAREAILDAMEEKNRRDQTFDGVFPRDRYRAGIEEFTKAALEAAAEWGSEHAAELVTEAMVDAAYAGLASSGDWRKQVRRAIEAAIRKMGR